MTSSSRITRRGFLQSLAATSAAAAVPLAFAPADSAAAPHPSMRPGPAAGFPADFWWGSATAAYQVEGAAAEDGRKPSIWDTFSATPGRTFQGETGAVACDHYHRYREDVALMAQLGVKHYRFSISWSRVLPDGTGAVNERGVDFYRRLCDALGEHGITPHATLYHWDLPQALQDRYRGWEGDAVVHDFAEYAATVARRLGDRVPHWMTLNEVQTFAARAGYAVGHAPKHAPGIALASAQQHRQLVHRVLLAHGRATEALRAASPRPCRVAVAENFSAFVPLIETPEHIAAARQAFLHDEYNASILLPILTGRYSEAWLAHCGDQAPHFTDAEMKSIGAPLDELGFNCYTGTYVRAADNAAGFEVLPTPAAYPRMNIPWLSVVPEAIYWGIRQVGEAAGRPQLPVFISENGCPDAASATPAGKVYDTDRIMYLRAYLRQVQRAVAEGYPVVGYFPWSLLDNFEWAEGYAKRFGLVHVDYATQQRVPKASYAWYQSVIRGNRVV